MENINNIEQEIWKDIPGYDGYYQVSSNGIAKSLSRYVRCSNGALKQYKGKLLSPHISPFGYFAVDLYKNCIREKFFIHQLVALAFIKNPLNKLTVNHKDGNKLNNNIENLEWATSSEQLFHAYKYNLIDRKKFQGENHSKSKLNEKQVREIKQKLAAGAPTYKLGQCFGVSDGLIWGIKKGLNWKHVII